MVQLLAFAAFPEDTGLIPSNHMVTHLLKKKKKKEVID